MASGQEGKRNETFSPTDCRLVFNQLVTEQVGLFFSFPPNAGSNYEARTQTTQPQTSRNMTLEVKSPKMLR